MQAFTTHDGLLVPLDRANINTDDIIPARYLTAVERTGFADGLFTNWRYLPENGQPDPAFPLNQPRYRGASILLARENFGCGSSREHAPWALAVGARIRDRFGLDGAAMASDDGVILRIPDTDAEPPGA